MASHSYTPTVPYSSARVVLARYDLYLKSFDAEKRSAPTIFFYLAVNYNDDKARKPRRTASLTGELEQSHGAS